MAVFNPEITAFNLKGYIVGNGCTQWDYDVSPSFTNTVYGFNLIPRHYLDKFHQLNCTYYFNDLRPHGGPAECDPLWDSINDLIKDLNWYDLYQPADFAPGLSTGEERLGKTVINGEEKTYKRGHTMAEYTPWLKNVVPKDSAFHTKILGDKMTDYLNREDVRQALHIDPAAPTFVDCNDWINENWNYQNEGSIWIYEIMKDNGYKIRFYSGDTDGAVPTYGSKRWIKDLNWPKTKEWQPWFTKDGQVAGYIEQYEGLDFVTVKGVGHMAPQYAREAVTSMVTEWMHGK